MPENTSNPIKPAPLAAHARLWYTNLRDLLNSSSTDTRYFAKHPIESFSDNLTMDHTLGAGRLGHYLNDPTRRRIFFDRLEQLELSFTIQSLDFSSTTFYMRIAECVQWDIIKTYSASVRGGRVPVTFHSSFGPCTNTDKSFSSFFLRFIKPIVWVALITIALSTWSNLLTFKSIIHRLRLFQHYRRNRGRQQILQEKHMSLYQRASDLVSRIPLARNVTIWDLPKFLSPWVMVTIAADIINTVAGLLIIFSHSLDPKINFFMGLGALITYCNIIRYFQYYNKFYVLVLALRNGLPNVARFLVSSFPVFFGYALCGTILFGHYCNYFADIDNSMVSLFALVNGDAIHEIFDMLYSNNVALAYISRVYVYSFVLLFICAVLNIFILIMEDAFFALTGGPPHLQIQPMEDIDISALEDDDVEQKIEDKRRRDDEMQIVLKEVSGNHADLDHVLNEESIEDNIIRLGRMVHNIVDEHGEADMDDEMHDLLITFEASARQLLDNLHVDISHIDRLILRSRISTSHRREKSNEENTGTV